MKTKTPSTRPRKAIFVEDPLAISALETLSRRHHRPAVYIAALAIRDLGRRPGAEQAQILAPDLEMETPEKL